MDAVRLLTFLAIGGTLFALSPDEASSIEITPEALHSRTAAEERGQGHALGAEEIEAVRRRAIEDEILYREGLRRGLDRDDPVVRQRVILKVLFLAEDLGGASAPITEQALREFHEAHAERYGRSFEETRAHVNLDYQIERKRTAVDQFLAEAAGRYGVQLPPTTRPMAGAGED